MQLLPFAAAGEWLMLKCQATASWPVGGVLCWRILDQSKHSSLCPDLAAEISTSLVSFG